MLGKAGGEEETQEDRALQKNDNALLLGQSCILHEHDWVWGRGERGEEVERGWRQGEKLGSKADEEATASGYSISPWIVRWRIMTMRCS